MRKIIFIPIIIVTLLLAASSCRQGRHHNSSSENDSLMYLYTDSLIRATCRNCNLEQSLHVIDSLLELDQISEMRADFGRAGAYMLNYQPDMCYRLLRKVINDYNAKGGDIRLYSMAVVNLSSYLGEGRSQYEAALQDWNISTRHEKVTRKRIIYSRSMRKTKILMSGIITNV